MIISSNAKFVIKCLLSNLNQQLALPLISQAIEYVNDEERNLGSKVINFWNSVGDMLNKKFKGKLKRNGNFFRKSAINKLKTDKTDESTDFKSTFTNQDAYSFSKSSDLINKVKGNLVSSANLIQMNSFRMHEMGNNNRILINYKPNPISGIQVLSNYQKANLVYATAPHPIYYSIPQQVQIKPSFGCHYIPFRQNHATCFYMPMSQN